MNDGLLQEYMSKHGYEANNMSTKLLNIIRRRISRSSIPQNAKDRIKENLIRVVDSPTSGKVIFDGPYSPSLIPKYDDAYLPAVYNNENNYKKKYKKKDPKSYILYHGKYKENLKVHIILNKPRGRGAKFAQNSFKDFQQKFPYAKTYINGIS